MHNIDVISLEWIESKVIVGTHVLNSVRERKKNLGNYIMSNSDGEFKVLMNNFSDVGVC